MTVAQLIAKLSKLPPDSPVYRDDGEFGPIAAERVEKVAGFTHFFTDKACPPGVVIK